MSTMRYLCRADAITAGALDWDLAITDIREATRLMHVGQAGMVAESVIPLGDDPRNKAYGLPAYVGGAYDAAGLKWTLHRAEPAADLPSITSTTLINALSDGRPLGMVESALLTRIRTAAVSAIAIESLAPNPRIVTILGAGAQAQTHLGMVLSRFPDAKTIHLWNRTVEKRNTLIANAKVPTGVTLMPHDNLETALAETDVILSCTSTPQPFIAPSAVRGGRLIVQVGFHEVQFETIAATDFVTVDLWGDFADKSAKSLFQMYRAGQFSPAQVTADLPAMVVEGWRPPEGASVYFSSFGLNIFDIALAARLLRKAETLDIGFRLPML
jgi:ornithine cyclodeaminase